jgi:hypothetical protein
MSHRDSFPRDPRILRFIALFVGGFFRIWGLHRCWRAKLLRGHGGLEIIRVPREDRRPRHSNLRSFMERQLAQHRDLEQHQRPTHQLDQSQQVKEAEFAGEKPMHRGETADISTVAQVPKGQESRARPEAKRRSSKTPWHVEFSMFQATMIILEPTQDPRNLPTLREIRPLILPRVFPSVPQLVTVFDQNH